MGGITLGVATTEADIRSGTISGVTSFGTASGSSVAFYGTTPITQRSGSAQAAVVTTAAVTVATGKWGFETSTQADAIVTLVNELRAALVALGLITGAA